MPTFIIPVLYRVEGDDPTDVWETFAHELRDEERAVFAGSPLVDTGCETFDVDVSDADERLRRLAPAEEFEYHDLRLRLDRFEQAARALAVRAGSMPEGSGSFIPYTVVGVYADNEQRFATTVQAFDPVDAERRACEEADGELIVAGVLVGELPMADAR